MFNLFICLLIDEPGALESQCIMVKFYPNKLTNGLT